MSWIIGRSAGSTQPSRGRVSLSLHSCQNPQFGMTINKISPSAIRHAVSHGSFFAGSASVPNPPPRRWEGI